MQKDSIIESFKLFLKDSGYRPTYVREKMLDTVSTLDKSFTIEELMDKMTAKKIIVSKTSGYNNIKLLFLFGAVSKTVVKDPVEGLVWKYINTVKELTDGCS